MLACLIYSITSFDACLGIIILLEQPIVHRFQPTSCWSEVKLKDLEVALLHYSIHFGNLLPVGAKQPQRMMLPPSCFRAGVLYTGFKALFLIIQK